MRVKRIVLVMCVALLVALAFTSTASALSLGLWKSDFKKIASDGQGDWRNIYAWSMASFKGDLYVGTARQAAIAPVMEFMSSAMPDFSMPAGVFPTDPPPAPFFGAFLTIKTLPSGAKVPQITNPDMFEAWSDASYAEIWRLHNGAWTKVYTAPEALAGVLKPDGTQAMPGDEQYVTPAAVGFRNMVPFTDANGVQALYASAGSFSLAAPLSPGYLNTLLYMSVDGTTWSQVVTPVAMGRETRCLGVHHGKLYAGIGTDMNAKMGMPSPPASVWCSATPSVATSWTKVLDFSTSSAPGNTGIVSLASANNHIYVGTENQHGYEVWRSTVPDPAANADWKQIVKNGAGDEYNGWAGTMKTFRNNVYVGSMAVPGITGVMAMKAFDLIRIKPDDKWQLLVGNRTPEVPVNGSTAKRNPLTGWPSGFGMPTNLYCWQLEVYNGYLYLGSMDMSSMLRAATEAGVEMPDMGTGMPPALMQIVLKAAGYDLWKSPDGLIWAPVTLTGMGNYKNYGARTIRVHNNKLYIGTANPFQGFQVWVGD